MTPPRGRKPIDDYSQIRGDDIPRIVHRLLNSHFWLGTVRPQTNYTRLHDDHDGTYKGKLTVSFGEDSDAYVSITDQNVSTESLRFRMPMIGGGISPRVRTALHILAEAIRLDNEEHPTRHPMTGELMEQAEPRLPQMVAQQRERLRQEAESAEPKDTASKKPREAVRCPGFRPPRKRVL